jgi:hypothetical protein
LCVVAIPIYHIVEEEPKVEEIYRFYENSKYRIIEIESDIKRYDLYPQTYKLQYTSPLKQERVYICSQLFHAVSLYNLSPDNLKMDKRLPTRLDIDFCLTKRG